VVAIYHKKEIRVRADKAQDIIAQRREFFGNGWGHIRRTKKKKNHLGGAPTS
jgi:hypothetical protein